MLRRRQNQDIPDGMINGGKKTKDVSISPYRIHLRTTEDIRRLLSGVVNQLRRGEIDCVRAGKIIYASQVLLRVFEQGELEARLERLEELAR